MTLFLCGLFITIKFILAIMNERDIKKAKPTALSKLVIDLSRFQTSELSIADLGEFRGISADLFHSGNYISSNWEDVLKQALALAVEVAANYKWHELQEIGIYASLAAAAARLFGAGIAIRNTNAKVKRRDELAIDGMNRQYRFDFGIDESPRFV